MLKTYYLLTKPGIIFGNLITTASGFFLASRGYIDWFLFTATAFGISCVIASACVFNNYIDRESDKKMARTKNRPLAQGIISAYKALIFATFMGLLGLSILVKYTTFMAVLMALVGFVVYVALYSLWKYHSTYATLVGSISGAIPPVIGYSAVTNRLDAGALLLFAILVLWQMPHFFAIAMYRLRDYASASIPVLPLKKGMPTTKIQMLLYIAGFTLIAPMLTLLGYTQKTYFIVTLLLGLSWLFLGIKGWKSGNDFIWARQMFRFSLVVIMILSVVISIDSV